MKGGLFFHGDFVEDDSCAKTAERSPRAGLFHRRFNWLDGEMPVRIYWSPTSVAARRGRGLTLAPRSANWNDDETRVSYGIFAVVRFG